MTGSPYSKRTPWLSKLVNWFTGSLQANDMSNIQNPPCPDQELAIIGDIHGRLDLLEKLLAKIHRKSPNAQLIFVGDYIDRGPSSRGVLDRLRNLKQSAICLIGNHEAMLLEFLDNPIESGGRWLRNGGTETLASYGISLTESSSGTQVQAAQNSLHEQLSDGTEEWLRSLPLYWQSGNVLVTHAGPNPAVAIEQQEHQSFLWGHNRFLRDARSDGIWVAHGHWIRDPAKCGDGRISVDTGACFSGRLTAAIVSTNCTVQFLNT